MYRKFLTFITLIVAGVAQSKAGSFNDMMSTSWINDKMILYFMYFVIIILLIFVMLLYRISIYLTKFRQMQAGSSEEEVKPSRKWERFFQVRSVRTDKDVMLDHDYDGIKELDNPAPPWFMYLFYGTILFAVIYFVRFQVTGNGPTQNEEYVAEMEKAAASKLAATTVTGAAVENITEENVTITDDPENLKQAKAKFGQFCASCHGQKGEGLVGPNLTDDYWIHGGNVKDLFKTIKYGVIQKGMASWGTGDNPSLSHKQIRDIASYILSLDLVSEDMGGKPPVGDLYVPEDEVPTESPAAEAPADSTSAEEGTGQ